jgi:hypothetical protein
MVKPLVVRASELRIDLLAELACVRGSNVLVKGFLILPDFDDRDVISARYFRAGFHSHIALILARIRNILLDQFRARGRFRRDDIDVRHDVNHVMRRRFLGCRAPRETECAQNQNSTDARQKPSHGFHFRLDRHFLHLPASWLFHRPLLHR